MKVPRLFDCNTSIIIYTNYPQQRLMDYRLSQPITYSLNEFKQIQAMMRVDKRACLLVVFLHILLVLCPVSKCKKLSTNNFCQVQFFGQEFLGVGKNTSQNVEVKTWLKTRTLYGVLVVFFRNDSKWEGHGLENGSIRSISSSRTPFVPTSSARTVVSMVTVNQWYHMHIKIHKNIMKLSITGELFNFTDTVHNMSGINVVYIGGIPLKLHKMQRQSVYNFTGCMGNIAVNRFTIPEDFKQDLNRKISFYCQSCKARTARLSERDSRITIFQTLNEKSNNLFTSFQFRTKQKDAFLAKWKHKAFDMQLIINDGVLRIRSFLKANNTETLTSDIGEILHGKWSNIEMRFSALTSKLILTLNGKRREIKLARNQSPLALTRLRLGGTGNGFVGCIRNMIWQASIIDLSSKPSWVKLNRVVVGDCYLTNTSTKNLGDTTVNIPSTFVNTSGVFRNSTDLFGNGSVIHEGDTSTSPPVSDISLFYQITATIVIVLFLLIVFYVAFVLIKNRFQKQRKKDDEQEEGVSSGQYRRSVIVSDTVSTSDITSSRMPEERENRINRIDQEKRYSQLLSVKHSKDDGRSDVRLLRSTMGNMSSHSFVLLTPQPQKRAQQFSFTDIPYVVLNLQDDQVALNIKDDNEETSCHDVKHEDVAITHEEAASPRIKNAPRKTSNTLNPSYILSPKVSSTYNWAYFRPDSETECSESERMRSTKNDTSYRPFSLRILEGDESDEEENDYSTGLHNNFQTFRSKSTDNVARGDFFKVCFDPYLSSSQGEKLVCFGGQSSSNPSVMSSPIDKDFNLQQKYCQQRPDRQHPKCDRYRKLQVDSSPSTIQKVTSDKNDKEKQEFKQNLQLRMSTGDTHEIPQIHVQEQLTNGYHNEDVKNSKHPLLQNEVVSLKQGQENQLEQQQGQQQHNQQQHQQESNSLKQQPENMQQQHNHQQQIEQQQGYQKQQKLQQFQKKQQQLQQQTQLEKQQQQDKIQKQQGCQQGQQHQQCLHQQPQHEHHCSRQQEMQQQHDLQTQLHQLQQQKEQKQQYQLKHDEQETQFSSPMLLLQVEAERKVGPLKHSSAPSLNESNHTLISKLTDKDENSQNLNIQNGEFHRNTSTDASGNAPVSNNSGFINPWVLKQVPTNRKENTAKLTRLNKPLRPEQLKARSSSQLLRSNNGDTKPQKVWKRSSWTSGNLPRDTAPPREQSRDIELVLRGTVPVKKPPSSAAVLLVPKTKLRPRSETMS